MAQENIKLSKTIYSIKSTDGIIDRSFSEFFKTKDPVNLDRFFDMYSELFYDIPKRGDKSHKSIIKQSQEYINDYFDERDETIDTLTERIIELEEELTLTDIVNEHPFYSNGTLIATDDNGNQNPDDDNVFYMDRGVRRKVAGGSNGDVFQGLKGALGFGNDAGDSQMVSIVPRVIFDGITEGPHLEVNDLIGITDNFETEQQIVSDVRIQDWSVELQHLIRPITNGSISKERGYVNLLKYKIKKEFEKEGQLESLTWKFTLDAEQGFTQQERDNGLILKEQARAKLLKSRQTLAILKRIWDKKSNFPDINFDEILPRTIIESGEKGSDPTKQTATQLNPLTEDEVDKAFSGWDEGRNLFLGVLEGEDYVIDYNVSELAFKSADAIKLLQRGAIVAIYDRYKKYYDGKDFGFDLTTEVFGPAGMKRGYFETYNITNYKNHERYNFKLKGEIEVDQHPVEDRGVAGVIYNGLKIGSYFENGDWAGERWKFVGYKTVESAITERLVDNVLNQGKESSGGRGY